MLSCGFSSEQGTRPQSLLSFPPVNRLWVKYAKPTRNGIPSPIPTPSPISIRSVASSSANGGGGSGSGGSGGGGGGEQ